MKTKEEILSKLSEIDSDERLHYSPANVFVNAPLALIQVELHASRSMLQWVLDQDILEQTKEEQ